MNTQEKEETLTLEILETIEKQDDVTQRHLADSMGVALGLANSYLKRCVRKGLIKIHQAPANRYLYYLTPKGFAEKSRLTAQYLTASFDFYRRAGDSITHIYKECEKQHLHRILFCGVSELAEIASLRAHEHKITVVGTYDPTSQLKEFLSLPVWKDLPSAYEYDACLLTALTNTNQLYDSLCEQLDSDRILVPSILGINVSKENTPSPLTGEDEDWDEKR
jgi:DNA-binding MarR family transcriptional regulator